MDSVENLFSKRCQYSVGRLYCLKLLKFGYPKAFVELFNLMKTSREKVAEVKKGRYLPKPLEDLPSKLNVIVNVLILSESSEECGITDANFEMRMKLGNEFQAKTEDLWLAEYFYQSCYDIVFEMEDDDLERKVRVMERMSFMKIMKGEVDNALDILNNAFKTIKQQDKKLSQTLKKSIHLTAYRIYMEMELKMGGKSEYNSGDYGISMYNKAVEAANVAESNGSLAEAHARIGETMFKNGNWKAALANFKCFLDLCMEIGDKRGICYGYLVLAFVYKEMGKIDLIEDVLGHCNELAVDNKYVEILLASFVFSAQLYTKINDHEKACREFQIAYAILKQNEDHFLDYLNLENFIRVSIGIAKAHFLFETYVDKIDNNTNQGIFEFLEWKARSVNSRIDDLRNVTTNKYN